LESYASPILMGESQGEGNFFLCRLAQAHESLRGEEMVPQTIQQHPKTTTAAARKAYAAPGTDCFTAWRRIGAPKKTKML